MWFVYVNLSLKDKKTYTGSTNDLKKRLEKHNKGFVNATKIRRPFKCIYFEKFETELEARKREKYLKSCAGRKFLKRKLFQKQNE